MKLPGRAAVAMTPFCQADANPDTTGFRFFAQGCSRGPRAGHVQDTSMTRPRHAAGYWRDHLQGRPYHISARRELPGCGRSGGAGTDATSRTGG